MNLKQGLIVIVFMLIFMYIGTTMYYNTGLGVTDFKLEEKDSNSSQYELSYMLRSVRNFEYLDCEYTLISDDGQQIGTASTILENITDGSFSINETINSTDNTKHPKQLQLKVYQEKYNPDAKNSDGSPSQDVFFEQSFDLNNN